MPTFSRFYRFTLPKPLIFGLLTLLTLSRAPQDKLPSVVLSTSIGDITLEVDTRSAPATAANFLLHVDAGLYDQGRFHRTVRPDNQPASPNRIQLVQAMAREAKTFPPILLERASGTGLRHQNGTISKAPEKPGSASNQFFIYLADHPKLTWVTAATPTVKASRPSAASSPAPNSPAASNPRPPSNPESGPTAASTTQLPSYGLTPSRLESAYLATIMQISGAFNRAGKFFAQMITSTIRRKIAFHLFVPRFPDHFQGQTIAII